MGNGLSYWLVVLVPLILQLVGLTGTVLIDPYISRRNRRQFLIIVAVVLSLLVQDVGEYICSQQIGLIGYRRIASVYGYIIRPVIIFLFLGIVSESRKLRPVWILLGINTAVYLTAFFKCRDKNSGAHHSFFRIDPSD